MEEDSLLSMEDQDYQTMEESWLPMEKESDDKSAELLALLVDEDWGTNAQHLQAALALLKEHPNLRAGALTQHFLKHPAVTPALAIAWPLYPFLRYRDISLQDLQVVLDLFPDILKTDGLHMVCLESRNEVIQFVAQQCPQAIKRPSMVRSVFTVQQEKLPIALYWERICRSQSSAVPLEAASNDYWVGVREICHLLWVEGEDDFVDRSIEVECWPLVSYFVSKASKSYWVQTDAEEAWKHKPPEGSLTTGALEIIDQLLLPNFPRKNFELELPARNWHSQQLLLPWIQNHADLKLIYLHSGEDDHSITIPPEFTDLLFGSISQNTSLQDFRISGNFQANWEAFTHLLCHAPHDLLTCHLMIIPSFDIPVPIPAGAIPEASNLRKLDLFRIHIHPQCFQRLMQLLVTLQQLQDLELILDPPEESDYNIEETTKAVINLLKQERLQRLTFGPVPLDLIPMCELLKENHTLEGLQGYFQEEKPEDYQQLVAVLRDHNRTLQNFSHCEFVHDWEIQEFDLTMGGLQDAFLFYTRFNRVENRDRLGRPQATVEELIDLLVKVRSMLYKMTIKGPKLNFLGDELPYFYDLLQQRPLLWANPLPVLCGRKRKVVGSS